MGDNEGQSDWSYGEKETAIGVSNNEWVIMRDSLTGAMERKRRPEG